MNFRELAKNLGLEEDEFLELVELFIETTSSDLAKLESAISNRAKEQLVEAAHSIKGAAGNIGFGDIHELAKKIEMNASRHIFEGSPGAAQSIREILDAISEALTEKQVG